MSTNVTPWFSASIRPVHIGEYEYKYQSGYIFRAYWDGVEFTIHDKNFTSEWGNVVRNPKENEYWRGRVHP